MREQRRTLGIFCALFANIIFGFSFIFSKMALSVSHPLIILATRFTIAFLFLNILWGLKFFKINTKVFKNSTLWLMGLAQPFLYFILELYGLSLVSSALSGVVIALVPVAVMLLSTMVLKEKPSALQWFFTAISIIGVSAISIISNNGQKNYALGIFLLIGAVICAGLFNILSRKQSTNSSPFERTYVMFLIGFIGFNLTAVITLKNQYFSLVLQSITNPKFIIAIIYLAIVSSVLAFLLYNFATANITAVEASSFSNIITVVTVLAGVLILKESMNIWGYVLCLLIIFGVWGVNTFIEKPKK
ncbi:MAG: DMT family transporter [Clostridia bacterium]|nr:DMT family transporter [Clostridia bacterium]